jgi:benzoyl-CoA reductase/2-hydroxyglutaryl-CoA dehydratase subunit BcrC/BadD/HgdB
MSQKSNGLIGFACSYAPLQVIHAAGFTPYRILPEGDTPDQAGQLLHDNLCPHVKRILDRGMSNDVPKLKGIVFVNSCDPMRRLADAWKDTRPNENVMVIDLPSVKNDSSVSFYSKEISRFSKTLSQWGNEKRVSDEKLVHSMELYNMLADLLKQLRKKVRRNELEGGRATLQKIYNYVGQNQVEDCIKLVKQHLEKKIVSTKTDGVPLFLFGNVLPDVKTFELFEECGAFIADDDLCTGSRMITQVLEPDKKDLYLSISRSLFSSPPCARTFEESRPFQIAENVLERARKAGAKGVIGYTLKFCDLYLSRLPFIREILKNEGLPVLVIEGDCSLGSLGQQQTRIEAFIEMMR